MRPCRRGSIASSKTSINPLPHTQQTSDALRPWQFFTLGALVCATVAVFLIRGTSAANLIFVCLAIFSAALVGLAALQALRPLATGDTREPEMIGSRTRAALEREKNLLLRSIKELEFDHAMGKVAEGDYDEMVGRLRSRAVRLLQQLDNTSSGYRDLIERELAQRLVKTGAKESGESRESYESRESHESRESKESWESVESRESVESSESTEPGESRAICKSCGTVNDEDARFCKSCGQRVVAMLVAAFGVAVRFSFFILAFSFFALPYTAHAQLQMPDPKTMSGIPRPVSDLAAGHVSVRVIRGQLSNNIQGQPVEMHAGGKVDTVKTDENGRAEFSGIAPGTTAKAVTTVDGERLESQEFPWPADGGIRLMLVATPKGGDTPAPVFQAQPGNVVLGDETRVIIDHTDDALQVYYILDLQNSARAPVTPPKAVVIDMPRGALSATVLAGAPQAVALGDHVSVTGPFVPGRTEVQIAFQVPISSGDVTFEQKFPLAVPGLAVLIKKVGDTSLTSPQLPNVQEREFQGDRYILAQGPALPAGATLALTVSGLPHRSPWPRRIALTLALVMLGLGAVAAGRRPAPSADAARIKQLTNKREKIFSELVRLEQQRRAGSIDTAKHAERRQAFIGQLERIYRDLDAEGGKSGLPRAATATARGGPSAAA
jgi:hypothetical protein